MFWGFSNWSVIIKCILKTETSFFFLTYFLLQFFHLKGMEGCVFSVFQSPSVPVRVIVSSYLNFLFNLQAFQFSRFAKCNFG